MIGFGPLAAFVLITCGVSLSGEPKPDWLVTPVAEPVTVAERLGGKEIVISNGLISRTFRLAPNAATVAYDNLMTGGVCHSGGQAGSDCGD